jgi:hypothetical protein
MDGEHSHTLFAFVPHSHAFVVVIAVAEEYEDEIPLRRE